LVIARFFARIFFRNAINIGLPVLEVPNHAIQMGDEISFDLAEGKVVNHTRQEVYQATPLPPVMLNIMQEGGLVPYLRKHKDFIL
jgi:3-isopropylmalate/(R)-2-methylmalate dehydratase small subunit